MVDKGKDNMNVQAQKIQHLKKVMVELYQKLGSTEDQAWYQTLIENEEFNDELGDVVSSMMANSQNTVNLPESQAEQENSENIKAEKVEEENPAKEQQQVNNYTK